jgi:hypothetical protein
MLILLSDSNRLRRRCFSHVQTTSNHTRQDLESRKDVPTPPNPSVAPTFAHCVGSEVLHLSGAKGHHAQAVLVVYGEEPASLYTARVRSNVSL